MTRAIMNGCNGKMGQCITGICAQDPDIEIVAGIDTYDGRIWQVEKAYSAVEAA